MELTLRGGVILRETHRDANAVHFGELVVLERLQTVLVIALKVLARPKCLLPLEPHVTAGARKSQ